jgi:hypothetical protein
MDRHADPILTKVHWAWSLDIKKPVKKGEKRNDIYLYIIILYIKKQPESAAGSAVVR